MRSVSCGRIVAGAHFVECLVVQALRAAESIQFATSDARLLVQERGSSLNQGPFWGLIYKGAVLYFGPKKGS